MQSQDHFNIPLENIEAAVAHQSGRPHPLNVKVPTRAEVATLPLDETSTFIYSGRGGPFSFGRGFPGGGGFGQNGGGLATSIRPMLTVCVPTLV